MWDLKKNFALIELLERVFSSVETAATAVSSSAAGATCDTGDASNVCCDENEDHLAVVYCTTCGSHLCLACSEATHFTRTLAKHRRIPLSEKPHERPRCPNHTVQVLEFTCLEVECAAAPLMCYICKDYGRHKGHDYGLLETEADKMRMFVANSVGRLRKFMEEVQETVRSLGKAKKSILHGDSWKCRVDGVNVKFEVASKRTRYIKRCLQGIRVILMEQEQH